jgi:hypothetical protein
VRHLHNSAMAYQQIIGCVTLLAVVGVFVAVIAGVF